MAARKAKKPVKPKSPNPDTNQESKQQAWSTYADRKAIIKMPLAKVCHDGPCEYRCIVPSPDTPDEAFCFNGHKPAKDGTCVHYADEQKWREENLPSLKKAVKTNKSKVKPKKRRSAA